MTTSQEKPFLSTLFDKERPPQFVLGYLRSSFINQLHDAVLGVFLDLERRNEISKAELARRLNKDPAQITRWLSGPGNFEIGTVSDLLAGMGYEPEVSVKKISRPTEESASHPQPMAESRANNVVTFQRPSKSAKEMAHPSERKTLPSDSTAGSVLGSTGISNQNVGGAGSAHEATRGQYGKINLVIPGGLSQPPGEVDSRRA